MSQTKKTGVAEIENYWHKCIQKYNKTLKERQGWAAQEKNKGDSILMNDAMCVVVVECNTMTMTMTMDEWYECEPFFLSPVAAAWATF